MTIVDAQKTRTEPHPQTHTHPGVSEAPASYEDLFIDQEVANPGIVPRFPDPAPSTMLRERGRENDSLKAKSSDWSVEEGGGRRRRFKVKVGEKSMIQIQDRDRELLRYCYEQQFLLTEHIQSLFKNNPSGREARRRIQELAKAGLVRREYSAIHGKMSLIRLTVSGRALAESQDPLLISPIRKVPIATLIHDALVTSVRIRLSQFWNAKFLPERAIKKEEFPTIPDGVFYFRSGNGVAIEVENSDKGRSRFLKLANRWADVPSIIAVLYIARDKNLCDTLQRYLTDADPSKPLALLDWPSLQSSTPRAWSVRGELPLLERREF